MNPDIAATLLDWYARQGRDLPWRRTRDPYRIWLSEVILQQTRVAQGEGYYLRFVARFPDAASLAAASEDEVLKLWQGLGYYSRARNLHAAARLIAGPLGGRFPRTFDSVRQLPGVGDYTAAAICSAAYGAPHAVLDGNVFRLLARLFDLDQPIDTAAGRRTFAALAREALDERDPGRFNQAIMDFGALQCTPAQPRCEECPFARRCLALAAGTVGARPVKRGRPKVRDRWFHYLHITANGTVVLRRREGEDIWRGLWEFPLIEYGAPAGFEALAGSEQLAAWLGDGAWRLVKSVTLPPHKLSHQTLHACIHRIETPLLTPLAARCAIPESQLGDYALPRLLERYMEERD